jgi:hypothetical protein
MYVDAAGTVPAGGRRCATQSVSWERGQSDEVRLARLLVVLGGLGNVEVDQPLAGTSAHGQVDDAVGACADALIRGLPSVASVLTA